VGGSLGRVERMGIRLRLLFRYNETGFVPEEPSKTMAPKPYYKAN